MMNFISLQDAKDFVNSRALAYVSNLRNQGWRFNGQPLMWHMNEGALISMFIDNGYALPSEYAQQALIEAARKGYIEEVGLGGVRITPQGVYDIGNWH